MLLRALSVACLHAAVQASAADSAAAVPPARTCSTRSACAASIAAFSSALPLRFRDAARAVGGALLDARPAAVWDQRAGETASTRDATYCPDSGSFDLVPLSVANLSAGQASTSWGGDGCFARVSAVATWAPASGGVSVELTGATPAGLLCGDVYLLATSFGLSLPVEISALAPTATLLLSAWEGDAAADVALNGIAIGLLPCGIAGSIASALATVNIFSPLSGNVSDLIASNSAFLNGRKVWNGPGGAGPLAPFQKVTPVDKAAIRSGDYLAILRFDGLDPMIAFGTGFGATGHSAVALWKGAELFVVEATDRDPFGPAVFFGAGIIVTPFDQWVSLAINATYNVAILPLAPSLSAAFDVDAAWSWFGTVIGASYGYSNFLFSVLDSADPFRSLPLPIDPFMLTPILNLADALLGPAPANATWTSLTVETMLVHGLNKRMGTACATFACIIAATNVNKAAGRAPASFVAAAAIPEDDAWRYGGNVSFVCSAFAAALYKVALAGELPAFAATEQTPIDNVRAAMFDGARFTDANCPGGVVAPTRGNGSVCQLMGPVQMPLDGFNTVPLYAGMNAACGSQWPSYERCAGGGVACAC